MAAAKTEVVIAEFRHVVNNVCYTSTSPDDKTDVQ